MQKRSLMFILAAVLALGVTTAAPPQASAEGSLPHGYPVSMWPTTADVARTAEWSAYGQALMLRELFRSGSGTYLDVCTDTGFQCVAGTGFNVNVSAGICMYNDATGAVAPIPAFRFIQEVAATAATDWSANPGADTYYVHVTYNDATADGVVSSDPIITVDTTANPAGAELTPCSIGVIGNEADATTYTITDLRTVGNGLHYQPTALSVCTAVDVTATDDLAVGDDANIVGTLTMGPAGGPATATIDAAAGTGDFSGTVEVGDLSIDSAVIASTPAEIDAVADLSAAGALPRSCKVLVDTAGERTGGVHPICTLPGNAVVTDVWIEVETAEVTEATKLIDVGPTGTAEGYAVDVSIAAPAFIRPRYALDGTSTWYATTTRGALLAQLLAGSAADDRGAYSEFPDLTSGGKVINYTVPAAGYTEFEGTVTIVYYELP